MVVSLLRLKDQLLSLSHILSPSEHALVGMNFFKPFQSETLDWHSVWINSGRPQSGFFYDMRRSTRKAYHEKVNSVLKRENQIKGIKIAHSYRNSNSRDFWKEAGYIRENAKKKY